MSTDKQIEDDLNAIGDALRRQQQPSARPEVMRRIAEATVAPPGSAGAVRGGASPQPARHRVGRFAAVAACAAVATAVLWAVLGNGGGGLGAQAAFAAAVEHVQKARTFAARSVSRSVNSDGAEHVLQIGVMFKEPSLERVEYFRGAGNDVTEVTIRDYAKQQQLQLFTADKTAAASSLRTLFSVEKSTGELRPTQLETVHLDDVRKLSARAVTDLGLRQLDGREVRVLRSADDGREPVTTVWADPKTNKPVQIELASPSKKSSFMYTGIRIDEPLDDALFSLDPPAGYATLAPPNDGARPPAPDEIAAAELNGKMLSKMTHLVMECLKYQSKTKDFSFPAQLTDLTTAGVTKERKLRTMLAAPDQPDGPPVIEYRRPRKGKDFGTEIVFYESEGHRRPGQVVVGMWDGHSEVLDEKRFEELMK